MISGRGRLVGLLLFLALAPALSCGEDGTAPSDPTLFEARLSSPEPSEGAVLVKLTGPVADVTAPAADTLLLRSRADTTWVFVALRAPGTLGFTIRTPELVGPPSVAVLQVVGPDDALRNDPGRYTLELEPKP